MSVLSKEFLSGSTDGRGILIVATATPGTLIHTAHATAKDEIWLWTMTDATIIITVEYGGVTDGDTFIKTITSADSPGLLIPGWILTNSLVVRAFAATTNEITVLGYVNRIT